MLHGVTAALAAALLACATLSQRAAAQTSASHPSIPDTLLFNYRINLLAEEAAHGIDAVLAANVRRSIAILQGQKKAVFYSDDDCMGALSQVKPPLASHYSSEVNEHTRSHLCGLAQLWQHGGYYLHTQTLPIRDFRKFIHPNATFTAVREDTSRASFAGFIGATPKHPIIHSALEKALAYYRFGGSQSTVSGDSKGHEHLVHPRFALAEAHADYYRGQLGASLTSFAASRSLDTPSFFPHLKYASYIFLEAPAISVMQDPEWKMDVGVMLASGETDGPGAASCSLVGVDRKQRQVLFHSQITSRASGEYCLSLYKYLPDMAPSWDHSSIPRLIHLLPTPGQTPEHAQDAARKASAANPGATVKLWSEQERMHVVAALHHGTARGDDAAVAQDLLTTEILKRIGGFVLGPYVDVSIDDMITSQLSDASYAGIVVRGSTFSFARIVGFRARIPVVMRAGSILNELGVGFSEALDEAMEDDIMELILGPAIAQTDFSELGISELGIFEIPTRALAVHVMRGHATADLSPEPLFPGSAIPKIIHVSKTWMQNQHGSVHIFNQDNMDYLILPWDDGRLSHYHPGFTAASAAIGLEQLEKHGGVLLHATGSFCLGSLDKWFQELRESTQRSNDWTEPQPVINLVVGHGETSLRGLVAASPGNPHLKSQRVVGVFDGTKSQEFAMEMFALEAPTCSDSSMAATFEERVKDPAHRRLTDATCPDQSGGLASTASSCQCQGSSSHQPHTCSSGEYCNFVDDLLGGGQHYCHKHALCTLPGGNTTNSTNSTNSTSSSVAAGDLCVCGDSVCDLQYAVIESGTCASIGFSQITSQELCTTAAETIGFKPSLGSASVTTSSSRPSGCSRRGQFLYLSAHGTAQCSEEMPCICAKVPSSIGICPVQSGATPHQFTCRCDQNICTSSAPYCYGGSSTCSDIPSCSNTSGDATNDAQCRCGANTCNAGEYCNAILGTCTTNPSCPPATMSGSSCDCGSSAPACDGFCYRWGTMSALQATCSSDGLCPAYDGSQASVGGSCQCQRSDVQPRTCSSGEYCNFVSGGVGPEGQHYCHKHALCPQSSGNTTNSTNSSVATGDLCVCGHADCEYQFSVIESGSCASSGLSQITSQALCTVAGDTIGFEPSLGSASLTTSSSRPSGCSRSDQVLYLNNGTDGTAQCSESMPCICTRHTTSRTPCASSACDASTHVLKNNSASLMCALTSCNTAYDQGTCCDARATCDTNACGSDHVLKSNAGSLKCAGASCTTTADQGTCCDVRSPCSRLCSANSTSHCCGGRTYVCQQAAACEGCTGGVTGQCVASGWEGVNVSTSFDPISYEAQIQFLNTYRSCLATVPGQIIESTASCWDATLAKFRQVYPGINARNNGEWSRIMKEEYDSIAELKAETDMNLMLNSTSGSLSDSQKGSIARTMLNRTNIGQEEVEEVMKEIAAKAAGSAARSCFSTAQNDTARQLCHDEAKQAMSRRLGRSVSDIEKHQILAADAARGANDNLDQCKLSGRTQTDCLNDVKQQIALTLGGNASSVDDSQVRDLLEQSAEASAFDSIAACRQTRTAAECATSDAVKAAFVNMLGVDSIAAVSDTEITARIKSGASKQAATFVSECLRLANGNRTAEQLCKAKDSVKRAVSTALGKEDVTNIEIDRFVEKGAENIAQNSIEACVESATTTAQRAGCLESDEVREQVRRALGRSGNVSTLEVKTIVRKGAARKAADQRKECLRSAVTEGDRQRCQQELVKSLTKKLGRTTPISDIEAAHFARKGAADVTTNYMTSCAERLRQSNQAAGSCEASTEIREAIANSLGKNASDVSTEDIGSAIQRGAEKLAADTVSACRRLAASETARAQCTRSADTRNAVASSLGLNASQVTEQQLALTVRKGMRKQASNVMDACATGTSSSCFDAPDVMAALREALGKPDASVVDVKVELRSASSSQAVDVRRSCAELQGSSGNVAACRSNADVKQVILQGLGIPAANASDDLVLELLRRGEENDAAERNSLCRQQSTAAVCSSRTRAELISSGAASDAAVAEVVLARGTEGRAAEAMDACTSSGEADTTTMSQCVANLLAELSSDESGGAGSQRLRRRMSQHSMVEAQRMITNGGTRSIADSIAVCSENQRSGGSAVATCVSDAAMSARARSFYGMESSSSAQNQATLIRAGEAKLREKNEAIADAERQALAGGDPAPFTGQQRESIHVTSVADATGATIAAVSSDKLLMQRMKHAAGSAAASAVALVCDDVGCTSDTVEEAYVRASGAARATAANSRIGNITTKQAHTRQAVQKLLEDQISACETQNADFASCTGRLSSILGRLRDPRHMNEDVKTAARSRYLRNMSACTRVSGNTVAACEQQAVQSKAFMGLGLESFGELVTRGAEDLLSITTDCSVTDQAACRQAEAAAFQEMGVNRHAVQVLRFRSSPLAVASILADCLVARNSSNTADADCRALAAARSLALGFSYDDMEEQVRRVATKKRAGTPVSVMVASAVDIVATYSSPCDASTTASTIRSLQPSVSAAGGETLRQVLAAHDDAVESICRVVLSSNMPGRNDAGVASAAASIRTASMTVPTSGRRLATVAVSADQSMRVETDMADIATSVGAGSGSDSGSGISQAPFAIALAVTGLLLVGVALLVISIYRDQKRKRTLQSTDQAKNDVDTAAAADKMRANPMRKEKEIELSEVKTTTDEPVEDHTTNTDDVHNDEQSKVD